MQTGNELETLDLSGEERSILRAITNSALAAKTLTTKAKAHLTRREQQVLEKASNLLETRSGVSTLKMPANQLALLESLLQQSARQLERYPKLASKAGEAVGTAVTKTRRGAGLLVHPLFQALERNLPEVSEDPNLATSLAREMKSLRGRLKRFRESVEIQIRTRE